MTLRWREPRCELSVPAGRDAFEIVPLFLIRAFLIRPETPTRIGIDITARLLEHATKTANSLSAQNVDLPVGDHKITVTIADNHGRTGSRVLRMSVAQ